MTSLVPWRLAKCNIVGSIRPVRCAFLGDGQAWNWTLQQKYFPDFVPIAHFVHPLGYLYEAAQVVAPEDHWAFYLHAATRCWQGRVGDVLRESRQLASSASHHGRQQIVRR